MGLMQVKNWGVELRMPESFYTRIKLLKRYSVVETLGILFAVLCAIFAIATWKKGYVSLGFLLALVVTVGLLYWLSVDKRRKVAASEPYRIAVSKQSVQEVLAVFDAKEIAASDYVSFLYCKGVSVRLLFQIAPVFLPDALKKRKRSANRRINQIYHISDNISTWEAHSMLRVNLLVCQEESEQLLTWLQRDADRLLSRAESIINAAVFPEKGELLFPACTSDASFVELKKYQIAGEMLWNHLSMHNS